MDVFKGSDCNLLAKFLVWKAQDVPKLWFYQEAAKEEQELTTSPKQCEAVREDILQI
jgi:hypothetical protein